MHLDRFVLSLVCIAAVSSPADAATVAYIGPTGTNAQDVSNTGTLNAAFGSGGWTQLTYTVADVAVASTYDVMYVERGTSTQASFVTFLNTNRLALETFVNNGGRLFLNTGYSTLNGSAGFGPSNHSPINLIFGASADRSNGADGTTGTAVVGAPPALFVGAGTTWAAGSADFAPDYIVSNADTPLILDNNLRPVLTVQRVYNNGPNGDSGFVFFGGLAPQSLLTPSAQAGQLRANILSYVASLPEPGEWLLLGLGGCALIFALHRRRKLLVA
ncbi:MAG: PEP-CTERM sorting domain-containing protein [Planctomycetes bacterium]|nr:PEP-CTERM sorting domain-containing protein [Planctomycetota bacterium]